MSVKITGIDTALRELAELQNFIASEKPIAGFVEDAKKIILEKTAAGRDYTHRSFAPYTAAYAKKKGSKKVDLRVSGTMLGAIFSKVFSSKHAAIDVAPVPEKGSANAQMVAQIHNTGTGKQPTRTFMNLNDSIVAKLKKKHWDDPILEIVRKYR